MRKTKLRTFNANVKYVLLYGSEEFHPKKLQILVDPCQRCFLKIKWSDWVSNGVLWGGTAQELMENQILKRKWRWIGHTLGKPAKNITGQAPARKEEKRSPQKYVEKRYGVRPEKVELHMAPAGAASDEEYRGRKSSMAFAPSGRQRLKHDQRRIIHFKLALGLKKQP